MDRAHSRGEPLNGPTKSFGASTGFSPVVVEPSRIGKEKPALFMISVLEKNKADRYAARRTP